MNAYYGAGPALKALEMGADIVVTGRSAWSMSCLSQLIFTGPDPQALEIGAAQTLLSYEC